ncbi:MAG TPA: hypothetical protein P5081_23705 [Phycisphaerae bacterium]|nr:hypothetical protein [Phycisphaerae bacterium]
MFPGEIRIRYPLTRRQRLTLTRMGYRWRFFYAPALIVALVVLSGEISKLFCIPLCISLFIYRRLIIDLVDLVMIRIRVEDIILHEFALGFISNGARWWVMTAGVVDVTERIKGMWTIRHYNGTVLHIPAAMVTSSHIDHLKSAAARFRGPFSQISNGGAEKGSRECL